MILSTFVCALACIASWNIVDVPFNLPGIDRKVQLEGAPAKIALPVIDGLGAGARMDFTTASTQEIRIANAGDMTLELEPSYVPPGISISTMSIAPNEAAMLGVTAADGAFDAGSQQLVLGTNDPDHPTMTLTLGKDVGGTDKGELDDNGGDVLGGCQTGGGAPGLVIVVVGLLIARRRRR